MENEYAKHETDYIRIYEKKGYTDNFRIEEEKLVNNNTKNKYAPEEIFIVAEHRYEGMSNPSDLSILYIIETVKKEKGSILLGYGPSADIEASEFFKKIPKGNISDKENINK